jgi:hypothetical protein
MQIMRMLEGRNFDPEAAALLVRAFDGVVDELCLRTSAEREKAAQIVIQIAFMRAALDAAEVRDDALGLIRDESIAVQGLAFDCG